MLQPQDSPGRSRSRRARNLNALIAAALFVVLATAIAAVAAVEEKHSTLDADSEALRRLGEVEIELRDLLSCSPSCMETLEDYRLRFGSDPRVVVLLRAAYQRLEDWEALIQLEEELPETARTAAERVQLAVVYHQAGRYREAASQLEDLLVQHPEDADLTRQSAVVLFELGDYEGTLARLDRAAGKLSGAQAAEAETLRGLAYFHRQDLARAEAHLSRALEIEADSVAALSGLARVLAARGRPERAQGLLDRAHDLRQANLTETRRKLRLSTKSQLTSDACVAKSWDECERLIGEMLVEANRPEQVGIYRYLAQILTLEGRAQEAQEALERSEALSEEPAGKTPEP